MKPHHEAWLSKTEFSQSWLEEHLRNGFHVHHVDGDHDNNDPANLVLMWGPDHMSVLHGMKVIPRKGKRGPRGAQLKRLRREFEAFWAKPENVWR